MNQVVVQPSGGRGEAVYASLVFIIHEIQSSFVSGVAFHILCESRESGGQGSIIKVSGDEEEKLGVRSIMQNGVKSFLEVNKTGIHFGFVLVYMFIN